MDGIFNALQRSYQGNFSIYRPEYTKQMNLPFNPDEISSFYLIVKTFESLYAEFKYHLEPGEAIYSIPLKGVAPGDVRKQYRGIDREPLSAVKRSRYLFYKKYLNVRFFARGLEDIEAQDFIYPLEKEGRAFIDCIFEYEDAVSSFTKILKKNRYELIWVRKDDSKGEDPMNSSVLGYDETYFIGDHFSAIADSMFFQDIMDLIMKELSSKTIMSA
jgi:hypothetical protein